MQFYFPQYLFLLGLIPLFFIYFLMVRKKKLKKLSRLIEQSILPSLLPHLRKSAPLLRTCFFSLAVLFLLIALSRPQWGEEQKTFQRKGINLVFVLDTSLSMLTEDIRPNRMLRAKLLIDSFLDQLEGDRVGLVNFAAFAHIQLPLTLDFSAFRLFLDASEVGIIPVQGTDYRSALVEGLRIFPKNKKEHKAIILLSDGEDHSDDFSSVLSSLKKDGVRVYTIGMGSLEGGPIPLRSERGDKITAYKKDFSGNTVVSRLEENTLKRIAEETGGKYFQASPSEREVGLIVSELQDLDKTEFMERK